MESPREPLAGGVTANETAATPHPPTRPPARAKRETLAERLEVGLEASDRWLRLFQDLILVAIAVMLLVMGVVVLLMGVNDLIGHVTLSVSTTPGIDLDIAEGEAVIDVAENALLALILAELVGTLLLTLRGRTLTVQPFLIIAVVAVVRHLLFVTVKPSADHVIHTLELLGLGSLILLLVVALVMMGRWGGAPSRHY